MIDAPHARICESKPCVARTNDLQISHSASPFSKHYLLFKKKDQY